MSYCKNCGTNIGDDNFCTNCGQSNSNVTETKNIAESNNATPTLSNDKPKSLSFIILSILSIIGVLGLSLNHYFKYYSLSVYGYSSSDFYISANYFELADSKFFGILAIVLMILPTILYVINIKLSKTYFYWISFGCEGVGLLYILISSLILCENFELVNTGSHNGSHYGYMRRFENFEFLFYLVLIVFVIMMVMTIFDALNKPLIKISKKSTIERKAL